jgi:hypothetical protein
MSDADENKRFKDTELEHLFAKFSLEKDLIKEIYLNSNASESKIIIIIIIYM